MIITAIYLLVSLHRLSTFPPVNEDEPWIAAAPYKLATEGVFGSDLFYGYHGADEHLFQLPAYSLLLAAIFEIAGVGVFQMRVLSVLFGLVLLLVTYFVGKQAGGRSLGLLSMILLVSLRLTVEGSGTGIPLLDIARVGRYDIAVPFFGMAALLVFNYSEVQSTRIGYFGSGMLTGLAGLSQGYGLFWLPTLLVTLALRLGRKFLTKPATYLIIVGCIVVWVPAVVYVITEWADFRGQLSPFRDRFDLLNPAFYLENVINERYRYGALFPPSLTQVGIWLAAIGIPVGLGVSLLDYRDRRDRPSFALAVAAVVLAILFPLLLKNKNFSYFIALWPLLCVILARGGLAVWDRYKAHSTRLLLTLWLVAMLVEGGTRIHHLYAEAQRTTPYEEYTGQIAAQIPPQANVLGLNTYWLGLRQFTYRSWLLTFFLSADSSISFGDALAILNPDVILLDKQMLEYFEQVADPSNPNHAHYVGFRSYMLEQGAALTVTVRDSTYGAMHVYSLYTTAEPQKSYPREPKFPSQ